MKNRPIKNLLLISILVSATVQAIGQNRDDVASYEAFDKTMRVKNAAFNNGKIHFNPYRSIDKTFRYYKSADFIKGEIIFDNQWYGNLLLKYDLLQDELVIKFDGEGNKMGFNPVKHKINAFYLGGAKFKNLDLVAHPDFVSGFYEEFDAGNVLLYTKYIKDQITSLTNQEVFYTHVERVEFVLLYQNTFSQIDNERDVVRAFPQLEAPVAAFFGTNAPLEKADRRQFMKKLATYLNGFLNTTAK